MIGVECRTAFQDVDYELLLLRLQTIVQNKGRKKWNAKSRMEAQVLLHQIKSLFSLLPPKLPSIFLDSHLDLHVAFHCRVQHRMLLRLKSMLKL